MNSTIRLATFAVLIAPLPIVGSVIYSDTSLNLAGYTQTTAFVSPTATSIVPSNCSTCGNIGGPALQVVSTFGDTTTTNGTVALGFENNSFSYNPGTQGTIYSVSASVVKDLTTNISATGLTNTFRPLIEQDGNFFLAAIAGSTWNSPTTGFVTLSQSGLQASDFTEFNFATGSFVAGNPNFSGDPMLFGLAQITTDGGNTGETLTAVYNNLSFTIVNTPEPSAELLMVSAIAVLVAVRLKKAHRSRRPATLA
jgi:hypothetical protein